MRKTIKKFYHICLIAVLTSSCQNMLDKENTALPNRTIHASIEQVGDETKTYSDGSRIFWHGWDWIAVYEGNDIGKIFGVSETTEDSTTAEFTEIENEGSWLEGTGLEFNETIAFYPAGYGGQLIYSENDDTFYYTTVFPDWHSTDCFYDDDWAKYYHIDCQELKMAARSKDSQNLSFKNAGGFMKFSIKGDEGRIIEQIILKGNSGEILSGYGIIEVGPDGVPEVCMKEGAIDPETGCIETNVTVDICGYRSLKDDFPLLIYVCLPPTDFKNGFTITLVDIDKNKIIKKTEKRNIVRRSSILSMPTFSILDDDIVIEEAPSKEGEPAEDFDFIEGEW